MNKTTEKLKLIPLLCLADSHAIRTSIGMKTADVVLEQNQDSISMVQSEKLAIHPENLVMVRLIMTELNESMECYYTKTSIEINEILKDIILPILSTEIHVI